MQLFTSKQYLQIDIANSFGLDKWTWEERLEWFNAHEKQLPNLVKDAEKPALFYAGIKAWEDIQRGKPTGYPVALDATSSGLQILACLTGDRSAAKISNVVNTGKRNDAYTALYEQMKAKVGGAAKLSRKPVKDAVMTAFYGSEAVPKKVFGEGHLLTVFYQTLEEACPAAWELNKFLLDSWNPETLKYSWVMPDNFHVHIKVMDQVQETVEFLGESFTVFRKENMAVEKGRSLGANLVHSIDGFIVRELLRRCSFSPEQVSYVRGLCGKEPSKADLTENTQMVSTLWNLYVRSGYLSARILDYLDATNIHLVDEKAILKLIDSLPAKPFKIIPVHDCFRVHPNYGNDLRRQYNLQLSLIAAAPMLQFLLEQILGTSIQISKLEDFSREIMSANYALS